MAKRFTDTNKYKKPFIRGLQGAYKLFWDFLYHDCDHAGIWIVDFDIAQLYLGNDMHVNKDDALKYFNSDEERIIIIDGGKKWFIPSFVQFQYGQLSENNRAHTYILSTLKKYNLLNYSKKEIKPLISPLQGGKEKGLIITINNTDKEELILEENNENVFSKNEEEMIVPEMYEIWKKKNPIYPIDQSRDYTALLQFAYHIATAKKFKKNAVLSEKKKEVLESWDKITNFIIKDNWLRNKPLSTILTQWQRIYQEMAEVSKNTHKSDFKPQKSNVASEYAHLGKTAKELSEMAANGELDGWE